MRQRLLIAFCTAVGLASLLTVRTLLLSAGGTPGISLLDARAGLALAVALVVVAALPAVLLGTLASALGNPLAGVFILAVSLSVLAGAGGPISGWLWRASIPGDYRGLMVEMVIWQAVICAGFLLMHWGQTALRRSIGLSASHDGKATPLDIEQFGRRMQHMPWFIQVVLGASLAANTVREAVSPTTPDARDAGARFLNGDTIFGCLISAAVGGFVSFFLLPNGNVGQVFGALTVAFTIGGLVARAAMPRAHHLGLMMSPTLVALAAYAYASSSYASSDALLAAWYAQKLPGMALVLPIYYASVAVAAVAVGVGIAQSFDSSRRHLAAE